MIANCVVCGKEYDKRRKAKTCSKECGNVLEKAYEKARKQKPEYKDYQKARKQTPVYKAYDKARKQTPVYKAYVKVYRQTPVYKDYQKARKQTPVYKAYQRNWQRSERAASAMGIPPILYAALKATDLHAQTTQGESA